MLIWAKKSEIDVEVINPIAKMYRERLNTENLMDKLKAWELSIIFRQMKRHFGDKKDISILDFGAGASPFGAYLNHVGYQFVTCLDIKRGWHREINEESYNKRYNAHVQYFKTNIILNYTGYHDVIFSASVLEHLKSNKRIDFMQVLARHLSPGGLFIHVVDYKEVNGTPVNLRNLKKLVDNCGIPISYKLEQTPGCQPFNEAPKSTWWVMHRCTTRMTRVAFFNEK